MSEPRPKVSVLMLTYNHASYVGQAIRSVFQQRTNFDYELLIADDCSTDDTVAIAECFGEQFPCISIFRASKNRGMYLNLAQIFYRARGEYIAFLEGDDYWSSSDKLEKQVQHLEQNPEAALCFHQVKLMQNGEISGAVFPNRSKSELTFEDLIEENSIPTCSVVFRKSVLPAMPSWCSEVRLLDWPLFLLLAKQGRVLFLPEPLSVYRIHSAGNWSQLAPASKSERMIEVLRCVRRHVENGHKPIIDRRISSLYRHIAWCCEEQKAFDQAMRASWKAAQAASFFNPKTLFSCLRLAVRAWSPPPARTGSRLLQP